MTYDLDIWHVGHIQVTFVGQRHRSKFIVTGEEEKRKNRRNADLD